MIYATQVQCWGCVVLSLGLWQHFTDTLNLSFSSNILVKCLKTEIFPAAARWAEVIIILKVCACICLWQGCLYRFSHGGGDRSLILHFLSKAKTLRSLCFSWIFCWKKCILGNTTAVFWTFIWFWISNCRITS